MKAVIQRVTRASVTVEGRITGEIKNGFLVLLGVMDGDTEEEMKLLAKKVFEIRIFEDENGKMNLSLDKIAKELGMKIIVTDHHEVPFVEKDGVRTEVLPPAERLRK